jgi:uncharacterized protein
MAASRVVVASGHLTDEPDRPNSRFPPQAEKRVTTAIRDVLAGWDLGPRDLVISQGARGADLIVAEQALERGAQVAVLLAKPAAEFTEGSVELGASRWPERFRQVLDRAQRVDVLPAGDPGEKPYARTNRWALDEAVRAAAPGTPDALVVWDGTPGDGGGGTGDFVDLARERGLPLTVIDPKQAWRAPNVPYWERQTAPGPKRMLSLDGGGIRGVLALEVLRRMETVLGGGSPDFVLADYFDYIAGTSTGAIIATGLALGKRVEEIAAMYKDMAKEVFRKRFLVAQIRSLYPRAALTRQLKDFFGEETTLGDDRLRSLLLVVLHRSDTDSIWPLSNNTRAKYNDRTHHDCNLDLPLWQVVRGSSAAPVFFPPEEMTVGSHTVLFQDGGVTPFNNPAPLLFEMASSRHYRLGWPTGEDRMLLVSVGTGFAPAAHPSLVRRKVNLFFHARNLLKVITNGSAVENDRLCRVLGSTRFGPRIDSEFDEPADEPVATPLFSYVRYTADLSGQGLRKLGFPRINASKVGKLDAWRCMDDLRAIGCRVAEEVDPSHFAGFTSGIAGLR